MYCYGMRCRPVSPGAQPKGLVDWADGNGTYWNFIFYKEPLSEEQVEHYQLDFIGDGYTKFEEV